ncbi:MAG: pyridoxal phosphate-dependent aminotransferase [Fimbriimonadaceae bacterium]|nr:pyridoxal phosphate-dependent aminotransferase [Fimbriimonadaceae bacterium]
MPVDVSRRSRRFPASPIRKLGPYAAAAKAQGVTVHHLNIGQPDVPSPAEFWSAVRGGSQTVLEYSPSEGLPELREGMAAAYREAGLDVGAHQIIVTTAGSEALLFAMQSCLDEGDEVIVPEPMYANYIGFAAAAGVSVVPLTTRIEEGFALPEPAEFEAVITPRTKAILVCNPGNPTGAVYTEAQLEGLRQIALKHNLFLIGDEVYRIFNYTGRPIRSVLQLEGMEDHAVMIDSVSKRYSLCGARVGFLVTRNEAVASSALRLAQARLSPPTLEQIGVLGALKTPAGYFDEVREEYRRRRDLLVEGLRAIPGVLVPPIDGAFYATVRLPIDDGDRFAQWLLESFRLDNVTVMVAPASGFYETEGLGRDEVRIAYVLNEERLARCVRILEAALNAYPGLQR